eukprot:GILK01002872.1.p1 GENE.GILK01002872.1~~GILK01002872.1.p1  ORF type:complete len:586 (-),score=91.06 GILK01002872.1:92-1849(-)
MSIMSFETQSVLAQLFLAVSEGERQVEVVRQVLAEQDHFEPYTAFRRLDRHANGFLTSSDILSFLKLHAIPCSEKDGYYLIRRFDTNGDGRLSYPEFLSAILPNDNPTLRAIVTSRSRYTGREDWPYDVDYALSRVLDKELEVYRTLEVKKQTLVRRADFNLLDAFRAVDEMNLGYITPDALRVFFNRNGYNPYEEDVLCLMRRLDKDADGRLSYLEFVDAVLPIEPYSRPIADTDSWSRFSSPARSTIRSPYSSPYERPRSVSPQRNLNSSFREVNLSPRISSPVFSPLRPKSAPRTRLTSDHYLSPTRAMNQSMSQSLNQSLNRSIYSSPAYSSPVKSTSYRSVSPRFSRSPLTQNEERELANAFREQINLDRELEAIKQDLALRADFNLLDSFKEFDTLGKGYVSASELEDGLRKHGVYTNKDELYLFFRRYDKDSDGRLRYSDFCEAFTPRQAEYASLLNNRVSYNLNGSHRRVGFTMETSAQFSRALRLHIENERQAEHLRQRLSSRRGFNLHDAFEAVDRDGNGFITMDEFRAILQDNGIFATEKELLSLMSRYDKNKDGRVSYTEFVQEVTPRSPSRF